MVTPPRPRFRPRRDDLRAMARLALPVVLVQVGLMTMGTADTIMVGHLSGPALAAVALGNLYFFAVVIFGQGALMALDPLVAQAVGARDAAAVARALQRGLLLAGLLALPLALLLLPAGAVFDRLGQPGEIVPIAAAYARVSAVGVPPFLAFIVLRQTLQALGRLRPVVVTIVLANLANVAANWVLIYGHLGAPPMGAVGSAWATVASRWLMGLGLAALAWPALRPALRPLRREVLEAAPLARMLRLGAPIGAQLQLEFGAFGAIGVLMGWLGAREMAGHQVALNLASLTFMVPLGISGAAAVLVGQAVGAGDDARARRAAGAALALATAFMALSALAFLTAPHLLARIYATDPVVVAIAALLLPIAGLFQLFDGWQVVSIGVLRGVGDTRAPMILNVLGFYAIGLPVSALLGFRVGAGPRGLWWGLVVGLGVVALLLLARVRRRLGRGLRRLAVEAPGRDLPSAAPSPTPPRDRAARRA
ncbi:MAG TPA: MATE family efflux transporter [Gemmatimonadales bacterium]|nr:MATE family efflux transporter [Gemmatimonadales bacterium]